MKLKQILEHYFLVFMRNKRVKYIKHNTNRIHVIIWFFLLCGFLLIQKLFSYTVLNYDFYQSLADKQQIWTVVVPVTRGTIYSATNQGTILGTSLNLYNIAIDPQVDANKEKLHIFLTDLVYMQICEGKKQKDCEENLYKFLRVLEIENFIVSKESVKAKISEKIKEKIYQKKLTNVLIDKELDSEQMTAIIAMWLPGIYPQKSYIYANPEEIVDQNITAKKLAPFLWLNEDKIAHLLRKRDLKYVPIINKSSIYVYEYMKEVLDDEKEAVKKGLLKKTDAIYPFIILETQAHRFYPENDVASQIIWFVDNNGWWNYGIEWKFNSVLKWNNGQIVSRKDVKWRTIDPIELNKEDLNTQWASIKTTIDRNIQKKVEQILENGVKKYRANKWTIVVMNPKNGNIIAMANYPTFDLNNYGDVYELEKVKYSQYSDPKVDLLWYPVFVEDKEHGTKFYYDNKEIFLRLATREELWDVVLVKYKYKNDFGSEVYKNDAISSLYEPGSIMKSITVAIGIDTGEINQNSMYLDEWSVKIDEFEIKNVSDKCLWYHSFGHALNYSCNVWMIRIVQRLWKQLMYNYLQDFGFWEITGIDLFGEVRSEMEPWQNWSTAKLLTNSYGLWISVTPLQMANAYSVIANWWIYMKPNIIDEIIFPNGKKLVYKPEMQRRVIQKSTSEVVSKMLVSSINDWVAQNAKVDWYTLAGKTGTSQIAYKGKYETWVASTTASFAWFWPAEDPRFTVVIKLDRPRTTEYGWASSAFLFQQVAEYLLDYYEIPKKNIK